MLNLSRLISYLPFSERRFIRNAWKRERVDFNKGDLPVVINNVYGVRGRYRIVGEPGHSPNVITAQGQLYLLETGLAGGTAEAGWYLALWQNAVTPSETWDAATFATTAGEIVSTTEGYTGTNRPAWTPDTPHTEPMSNSASPATYNIVTASAVTIQGPALISSAARGSTAGILMSAAAFSGGPRTQSNGDTFRVVYEESLQPL